MCIRDSTHIQESANTSMPKTHLTHNLKRTANGNYMRSMQHRRIIAFCSLIPCKSRTPEPRTYLLGELSTVFPSDTELCQLTVYCDDVRRFPSLFQKYSVTLVIASQLPLLSPVANELNASCESRQLLQGL